MQQFECFFIKTTAIFQSYRVVPRKVSRMEVASPTVSLRSDRPFFACDDCSPVNPDLQIVYSEIDNLFAIVLILS